MDPNNSVIKRLWCTYFKHWTSNCIDYLTVCQKCFDGMPNCVDLDLGLHCLLRLNAGVSLRFLYLLCVAGYYGFTLDIHVSVHPSVVLCQSVCLSFLDDNLSKHQWIFTKLGMCIDIVEIWFGIANRQFSSNFDWVNCPRHAHIFFSGR